MEQQMHTIDASGQTIGRIASEAARLLMGKASPAYTRHQLSGAAVHITNAGKARIPAKKLREKEYLRHSLYPGGQRMLTLEQMIAKKGIDGVLKYAIEGMLPKNKLRPRMLHFLTIDR